MGKVSSLSLTAILLAGLITAGVGSAATLYSAPPNQSGASDLNSSLEADDVTFGSTVTITQIMFWSFQGSVADYAGSIFWAFSQDAAGVPGAIVAQGSSSPAGVATVPYTHVSLCVSYRTRPITLLVATFADSGS